MLVVVPDTLRHRIERALDAAVSDLPKVAQPEAICARPALYQQLLEYFNKHGVIPEFSISKRPS